MFSETISFIFLCRRLPQPAAAAIGKPMQAIPHVFKPVPHTLHLTSQSTVEVVNILWALKVHKFTQAAAVKLALAATNLMPYKINNKMTTNWPTLLERVDYEKVSLILVCRISLAKY